MQHEKQERCPATILVIDDDEEMLAVLKAFLEREGHRVLEHSRGEWAIAAAECERVDAVILDKELPRMNGFDLLAFFRRRWPEVPVILITAFGGQRVKEEALRLGAARYLEKPFRVAELLDAVHALTRKDECLRAGERGGQRRID